MVAKSKKDKLIEEAQKFALRCQFDKAAKVYEQILVSEPDAINQRQKLAEMLVKCGRRDNARKEFETIGKYFSKNGFYLKAIAVYKQLQKLFPADISISLTLAELNEKHGLVANSLAEYKLVYNFYKENGNIPESLGVLERMQKVDPQNIQIKIKLAEDYLQQGKKDESYAVFTRTASLLLERCDNVTLSHVCTRIQQIFPNKPDFMLEVLSEQISQGNAATAIGSLLILLRNSPKNKYAWDLTAKAYKLLGQLQRVKTTYQHYLNFFPAEPAAILGLISSVIEEQNLAGAIELLDKYESTLISAGFLKHLEDIYHSLDKIDPISIRVLDGLIKVAVAAGNESEVSLLTSKRQSLRSVSGGAQTTVSDFEAAEAVPPLETVSAAGHSNETAAAAWQPDEEIEIDIDFNTGSPSDSPGQATLTSSDNENWLESVGGFFDTISTAPRGVKFGNEMEGSDAQSHFDLGQAFKEMGLYDEAINEFRQASQDASRLVECLIMQCTCLRERGDIEKAIAMLQALLKPGLSEEENCAVKYEMASGYEAAGRKEEATTLLNEINAANPHFRDIRSRLNAAAQSGSPVFSAEDLQDF
ncbi:MAG: tetratricopeptide repeat protein [Desulfuromonadaceae bacterium]|nr:tetratricopeptide repeat protein [Desulfuromonadaceae bacterium]